MSCSQGKMVPQDTPNIKQDQRMRWWREARFGLFIHWGIYSLLGGEWKSETHHAEWIRDTAKIPLDDYNALLSQFNPVYFNADQWVELAKEAGMKYIIITTKHHDGFALFDSKFSEFDVMSTPFKRDIMKELADAARKQGIKIGWYHSIMDWHHFDYLPRRPWEDRSSVGANYSRYFDYLQAQVSELLKNYGEIGVMWFDGEWEHTWNTEYGKRLYELCRQLQPQVLVNNRVDVGREGMAGITLDQERYGDFGTPEQEVTQLPLPGVDWESCITMNRNWGFNKADISYKSSKDLIHLLVDVVSKGGNLLLNVGPQPDGLFPEMAISRLQEIGQWMKVNSVSIYNTQMGPLQRLQWGRSTAKRNNKTFIIYCHVFDWPANGQLQITDLGTLPTRCYLLSDPTLPIIADQKNALITLSIPASKKDEICPVIALEFDREPIIYHDPIIAVDSPIFISSTTATINCIVKEASIRYTLDGTDPSINSPKYHNPIKLDSTTIIKAKLYYNDFPVSNTVTKFIEKVKPLPATQKISGENGLFCETYLGNWNVMPKFGEIKLHNKAVVDSFAFNTANEYEARRYLAYLFVPEEGVYEFELTSDDGSILRISEQVVIDNDGLHSATTKSNYVALTKGFHLFDLSWFNKTGYAILNLRWALVGHPLKPLTKEDFVVVTKPKMSPHSTNLNADN